MTPVLSLLVTLRYNYYHFNTSSLKAAPVIHVTTSTPSTLLKFHFLHPSRFPPLPLTSFHNLVYRQSLFPSYSESYSPISKFLSPASSLFPAASPPPSPSPSHKDFSAPPSATETTTRVRRATSSLSWQDSD